MVEYKYDAWGEPISRSYLTTAYETLGRLNPFRYRGYVYDEETGLYYLRSRYYRPGWGRFVNADSILGIGTGLLSHNTFTYSCNAPTCRYDPTGNSSYLQMVKNNAYAISSADANLPFGDILTLGLLVGAAALDGIINIANSISNSRTRTRAREETREDDEQKTYIYRSATGTAKSLTLRKKDTNGLSFSTVQPSGKYFRTTVEAVNATGVLFTSVDPKNPTHILINPVDLSTMQEWIDSRETADVSPHYYTLLLKSLEQ